MSSITEQVGRVVGRRYRLLAPVGSGASSQVFAAMDARLGRRVAVKVLHPMLTSDAAFLRRFQAEARLAASLDHPHIMRVFDWGEDDGGPFLVLEFLAGGSLRRLLDAQGRLSEEQVAHIGLQAASGLAYAHRRGIVHRDIKPGNLLFDDEGNLRLGDFGVARALAEAALTEPLGAIFGTARYASPEQAEGRPLDDRTDVYSLALVMYEALTGSVPFTRDTVSATLMARVGATLPPVRELGALGPIIAQAAISEPLARLDARAMALDLELLCRELPAPAALPLEHVVLEGGAGRLLDRDPTDVDAVRPSSAAPAAVDALERNGSNAPPAHAAPGWADRDAAGAAAAAEVAALVADPAAGIARPQPAPAPAPAAPGTFPPPGRLDDASPATDLTLAPRTETAVPVAPAPPASHKRTRRRLWPRVLLALVVLAVAAGGTAAAVIRLGVFGHDVPRLVGLPEATAAHDAHLAGLKLRVTAERYDLSVPKGDVITQSIRAGKAEKTGTVVGVVVSKGPAPVPVPSLKGDSIAAARAALLQGHLHMKLAAAVYSETVPSGVVISWTPSSGLQARNSVVTVTVSKGPHPRVIPSVGHGSYATAAAALEALRLVPKQVSQHSTQWPAGDVIETLPPEGTTVPRGDVVEVVVSLGPPLVKVPAIEPGESVTTAVAALKHAGLVPQVYGPGSIVFAVSQQPGSSVPAGSTVYVFTV